MTGRDRFFSTFPAGIRMTLSTPEKVADSAEQISATGIFYSRFPRWRAAGIAALAVALAGCSALPAKPTQPVQYDFGSGPAMASVADGAAAADAGSASEDAPLALDDISTTGLADTAAVLYRLQYADGQQLRPYSGARWSVPPAQLVRQRLRERLGAHRAILSADDISSRQRVNGKLPLILRLQMEEFSQVFASPTSSQGVLRLRATLVENQPQGERLLAQRVFVEARPAPTNDAPGGVAALVAATDAAAADIDRWVHQVSSDSRGR
jgi:cholesterol transport system auxiliary component